MYSDTAMISVVHNEQSASEAILAATLSLNVAEKSTKYFKRPSLKAKL